MKKNAVSRRAAGKPGLYGKAVQQEEHSRQYVLFRLGEERFAVSLDKVQEILVPRDVTEVPFAQEHIAGIVNLRGRIVTVVDLRRRFGLPPEEVTRDSRVVVVEYREQSIGLMVDAVPAVIFIPTNSIEPVSTLIAGPIDSDFFSGIVTVEGGVVTILDLEKTLRKQNHVPQVKV